MIDAIRGKDGQRSIGTKSATKHAFGESQSCVVSLGVADSPLPAVRLLYDKDALRGFTCPEVQPVADPVVVICQRFD